MTTIDVSLWLPGSLSQKSSVRQWEHFKHLCIRGVPNIVNACTIFRGTRDDKINDCGLFKYSVAQCN